MTRTHDYSWGPGHSPAAGAFNAAAATAALTTVAHDVGVTNPLWGLAVGGAAAVTAGAVALLGSDHEHMGRHVACYRAVCWLGAGIWSTVQLWSAAPWTVASVAQSWAWLASGTIVAAAAGAAIARSETRARYTAADTAAARVAADVAAVLAAAPAPPVVYATPEDAVAGEWEPRLQGVCRKPGIRIVNVLLWPNGNGYTLDVDLPADGSTIDNVKAYEKSLATAANLPPGCKVEVMATTGGRRSIHVKVTTTSVLGTAIEYPREYRKLSINEPVYLGLSDDLTTRNVSIREANMVVVGQVQSGKSNLVNCVIAGGAQRPDTFICAVDQSGQGRFPRAWIRSWKEGRARKPAIGWPAINEHQTVLMTLSLIEMINGRTADYADLMLRQNSDKILPTPTLPQILLVIDEFKTLSPEVKDNVVAIAETGRGAAVRVVVSALEANGSSLPKALRKQCRVRVGMRVSDETELQYLFDTTWRSGRFDPSTMTHPGMGMVTGNGEPPAQFKAAWLDPDHIDDIAVHTGGWRPDLDEASIARGDTVHRRVKKNGEWITETYHNVFTDRWDAVLPAMFPSPGSPPPERPQATVTGSSRTSAATALAALEEAGDDLAQVAERAAAVTRPQPAEKSDDDRAFDEIVAGLDRLAEPRERARAIIRDQGPILPDAIVKQLNQEGYHTVRQTVHQWLRRDLDAGFLARTDDGWVWTGP